MTRWRDNRDIRDNGYIGQLIIESDNDFSVSKSEAAQTMFNIITDDIENAKKIF